MTMRLRTESRFESRRGHRLTHKSPEMGGSVVFAAQQRARGESQTHSPTERVVNAGICRRPLVVSPVRLSRLRDVGFVGSRGVADE
jgi:hypothetical protein